MELLSTEKDRPPHRRIEDLIEEYFVPHAKECLKILEDNRELFMKAPGSSHNHQAWPGGYLDHVHEVMNIAVVLYRTLRELRPLSFSLGQALLVLFLHDLEKPWRYKFNKRGELEIIPGMETKEQRQIERDKKIIEYGIMLTPMEGNAFQYVEGEGKDYTPDRRVMNELAAFCHLCDVWSARGWWDYPKAEFDFWPGAERFRTKVV